MFKPQLFLHPTTFRNWIENQHPTDLDGLCNSSICSFLLDMAECAGEDLSFIAFQGRIGCIETNHLGLTTTNIVSLPGILGILDRYECNNACKTPGMTLRRSLKAFQLLVRNENKLGRLSIREPAHVV